MALELVDRTAASVRLGWVKVMVRYGIWDHSIHNHKRGCLFHVSKKLLLFTFSHVHHTLGNMLPATQMNRLGKSLVY